MNTKEYALSLKELKDLELENSSGVHVWVKLLPLGIVYAAIIDYHDDYGIVAIWCASDEKDWLKEKTYGEKWLAYLEKPAENVYPEPPPRW